MAQQTAVQFLLRELRVEDLTKGEQLSVILHICEQAKQMEKEQIEKAFSDGQETPINHPTLPHYSREEYYNETYVENKD